MNKNVIFGVGGMLAGTGVGFVLGKMTYKKKLDKAERDIEVLLKEINHPEEDSEVSDEEGTEEEEDSGSVEETETVSGRREESYQMTSDSEVVDYDSFYSGPGYKKRNYISNKEETGSSDAVVGVDPAEREFPEEDDDYEDLSSDARDDPLEPWEEEEVREQKLRQEMIESGLLITKDNENYEAGLEMTNEMNSGRAPKLISEESYSEEYLHHQKCILEYYAEDDILVDTETNEEIDDEMRCVGTCLDKYGFRYSDEMVIYVRNFAYGIDYIVQKTFKPYNPD